MVVKLLDSNSKREYSGSERELEDVLRTLFPRETENEHRFLGCVDAVNNEGFAEVDVEPVKPESNLLPVNYDTAPPAEDPWPREGDQ
jgi:hypothetical protein